MPSGTTQNIGTAVQGLVSQQLAQSQARDHSQVPTAAQHIQASQVNSDKQSAKVKVEDKKRSLQVPKKSEANFAGQEIKSQVKKRESSLQADQDADTKGNRLKIKA